MINKVQKKLTAFLLSATMALSCVCTGVSAVYADKKDPIADYDFNSYEIDSKFMAGTISQYKGEKVLKLSIDGSESLVFDCMNIGETAISFDLAAPSKSITGRFSVQGGGSNAAIIDFTADGRIITSSGKQIASYSENFKNYLVVFNYEKKAFDLYIDGRLAVERCYCNISFDKVVTFTFSFEPSQEKADVYIDNILAYPTYEKVKKATYYNPDGASYTPAKKITLTSKTTLPKDDRERQMLKGSSSIHMRSGVMYANENKKVLKNMPYYAGDEYMVPKEAIEYLFATTVSEENGQIRVGESIVLNTANTVMKVSGTDYNITQSPQIKNDVLYLPLRQIAEKGFGKRVSYDANAIHFGAVVISDSAFTFPSDSSLLQSLNDFCFFERPDKDKFLSDYNASPLKGQHPRIYATQDDFDRLRTEIKTNETKKRWFESLIAYCDEILQKPTLKYELRDGVRLMYVSNDCQMWMTALGMAYKLTGERKYFDCAWKHLEVIATMPDWNPSHHIDVGIMALGYAIAYDWFYDEFTPEQRAIMEKGAYNNCLWTVNKAVEDSTTAYGTVKMLNNHNVFVNAGNMAVCIAFMDIYPEECSKVGSDIVRILEYFIDKFAPDGQYYEGPDYATIALDYMVKLFSAMYPTMGTLYSHDKAQGIELSGEYLTNMQSDVTSFNFADSDPGKVSSCALFWLYDHFDIKGAKDGLANGRYYNPNGDILAHCLLWYDVSEEVSESGGEQRLDVYYDTEEIITMRNSYDDGQVFVGIKAGDTVYAHSHLDSGSFVFDAMGKRWAHDLGKDDYNMYDRYGMWNVFRIRAESHNTLLINPDESPGYELYSSAPITSYESKPQGVIAKIDMTNLYGDDVKSARRGYFFTDNRRSLVVRDEVVFSGQSEAYWLMYTDADADITDNNTVILTDKENANRKLKIEFMSDANGEIGFEEAKPFPKSPKIPEQNKNEGYYRLYYKINTKGSASITAKITPLEFNGSSITQYHQNMDNWQLPDGKLCDVPKLDSLTIGTEAFDGRNRHLTVYVLDEETPIPHIEAKSDTYNVEIKNTASLETPAEIIVSDKNDSSNSVTYTIRFLPRYRRRYIDGYNTLIMRNVEASAEPQIENGKDQVLDGDLFTRWSAEGRQWLLFDLEEIKEFDTAVMAFYLGDERSQEFGIEVSQDGINYTSAGRFNSSGTTTGFETFDIGAQKARYVKVNFFGTSTGTWNSPSEIVFATKEG